MELELKRADLMRALGVVTEITPKKSALPILRCAVLDASEGKLVLEASDLYVSCRTEVAATVTRPGRIALPAAQLADLVRAMSDREAVRMQLMSDGVVYVRSGKSKYKLSSVSLSDYVALPQPDREFGKMAARAMRAMLEAAAPFVGNEGRPQLMGVLVMNDAKVPGRLRVCASDGLRVLRTSAESAVVMSRVVLPQKGVSAVMELLALPKRGEDEPELSIAVDGLGSHVFFAVDKTRIGVKLMDDQFPDFDRAYPVREMVEVQLEASRTELMDAARRALVVADAPGAPVRLVATTDALLVGSSGGEGASGGVDEVGAAVTARPGVVLDDEAKPKVTRMSLRFFADAVRVMGTEKVTVGISGERDPVVIYGGDGATEALVMPMLGV